MGAAGNLNNPNYVQDAMCKAMGALLQLINMVTMYKDNMQGAAE